MESWTTCIRDGAGLRVGQRPKERRGREGVLEYQQGRMETMTTALDILMSVASRESFPHARTGGFVANQDGFKIAYS